MVTIRMSAAIHSISNRQPKKVTTRASAAVAAHNQAMIAALTTRVADLNAQIADLKAQVADEREQRIKWTSTCFDLIDLVQQNREAAARSLSRKGLSD